MIESNDTKARNEFILRYNSMGFSPSSIVREVNNMAETLKRWEPISLRTVQRIIAEYYKNNQPDVTDMMDQDSFMRMSLLMQMQTDIERLSLYIQTKDKDVIEPTTGKIKRKGIPWKPFEFARALETLHKMRADFARINNWDYGASKNPPKTSPFNGIDYKKVEETFVKEKPEALKQLSEDLRLATKALGESAQKKYLDEEDDLIYSELGDSAPQESVVEAPKETGAPSESPVSSTEGGSVEVSESPVSSKNDDGSVFDGL